MLLVILLVLFSCDSYVVSAPISVVLCLVLGASGDSKLFISMFCCFCIPILFQNFLRSRFFLREVHPVATNRFLSFHEFVEDCMFFSFVGML